TPTSSPRRPTSMTPTGSSGASPPKRPSLTRSTRPSTTSSAMWVERTGRRRSRSAEARVWITSARRSDSASPWGMVIRIDPGVVRVWRSPRSVQFGVDTALAVVNDLDAAKGRVLDALAVGTGVEGLRAVGSQYGLTHRQVDEVRRAVSAVLIDSPEPTRPPRARVAVAGGTPTASEVARLLTAAGVTVT